jgi:triphosphoribosyl-dephospho-CoA synthetase
MQRRKEIVAFLKKNNIQVVGNFVSKEDIRAFLTKAKAEYEIGDNLDDVSIAELAEFEKTLESKQDISEEIKDTLLEYIENKKDAIKNREEGFVKDALRIERKLDALYSKLPKEYQW